MIIRFLNHIADKLTGIPFMVVFFVLTWFVAWVLNGHFGTKFDLTALRDIFTFLMAKYGIDSIFNSNKGVKPE